MLEVISQNVGSPVFWMSLGWCAIVVAIVNSILYRKNRQIFAAIARFFTWMNVQVGPTRGGCCKQSLPLFVRE